MKTKLFKELLKAVKQGGEYLRSNPSMKTPDDFLTREEIDISYWESLNGNLDDVISYLKAINDLAKKKMYTDISIYFYTDSYDRITFQLIGNKRKKNRKKS